MIVLTLTDCPPALRGELTRWLLEVNTGVYVGKVSARVRDHIWHRVQEQAVKGRATMVFSTGKGEQRLDFRTHNADWEPIDFDGLKLMLRPSSSRLAKRYEKSADQLHSGYSKASKFLKARQMSRRDPFPAWNDYVVIDVETTGLSPYQDEILEIGAIKVRNHEVIGQYQTLIKINGKIPQDVAKLTGITDEMLEQQGKPLKEALTEFMEFVQDLPVIVHNSDFDYAFLRAACGRFGLPLFSNRRLDTLAMARRFVDHVANFRLETLLEHFGIEVTGLHRSLNDCFAAMQLYIKLNEIRQNEK